jgi:hypothetical protein
VLILALVIIGVLALGVLIGGIAGAIITGDWRYTITLAIGVGVFVLCLAVVAPTVARRAVRGTDRPLTKLPRAARTTIAIVLVVSAAAITLLPSADSISRIGTDQSFLTGPNQVRAVEAIAGVVGTHELVDIDFYDGYVDAQAPSHPGANTTDDFEYRYGHADRTGQEPDGGSAPTKTAEYDARKVDFALIPKLIKDAERRSKTHSPTSLHVFVMQPLDSKVGQAPTINIEVDTAYRASQVHYSASGKFIDGIGDGFKGD